MYLSLNSVPELRGLPPPELRRAWFSGVRYAMKRWQFLIVVIPMFAAVFVLNDRVIQPAVHSRLWRMCITMMIYYPVCLIMIALIIHCARPHWRQTVKRDA